MNQNNLHLFTASFPCEDSPEQVFIESELDALSKAFNKVYIYPLRCKGESLELKFSNVEVIILNLSESNSKLKFRQYLLVFKILCQELVINRKLRDFKNLKYYSALLKTYIRKSNYLLDNSDFNENDLLYTYWLAEWNYLISLLKHQNKLKNLLISKAHRFDIYDERHPLLKIPFRKLQLNQTNKIYSISEDGVNYFKTSFPSYAHKFELARLGSKNKGSIIEGQGTLTLVSCSMLRPVKRVHLIIDILKEIHIPVNWIHFGDGTEMKNISSMIGQLPSNVSAELRGFVTNNQIIEYYKTNKVDVFINVSSSEGIPVSMMEAISFGIPLIGFNVGGISEIINNETGLIYEDGELDPIISTLNSYPENDIFKNNFKFKVIQFWRKHYSSEVNSKTFSNLILKLVSENKKN